jgi:hypothetical protein
MIIFSIFTIAIFILNNVNNIYCETDKRIYYKKQFKDGTDHLILPRIIQFSLYMGKIHYTFFPLTLESMRYNPNVTFVLINIIDDNSNQADETIRTVEKSGVKNFILKVQTIVSFL